MLRLVPPAGTPVSGTEILRIIRARFERSTANNLETAILNYTGTERVFYTSSGQAAQYLILKAFAALSAGDRDEVVIPAYTCYTVAASVARAGLKIRAVDINPATLDYDYECLSQTDLSAVLAINSSNLFGILSDWSKLRSLKNEHALFTIDDAAQSFGSHTGDSPSGTQGDAGFYSLGRGKNLPAWAGGILVTSDHRIARELEQQLKEAAEPGLASELVVFAKYILSVLLLRPRLYWLPAMLPFLRLGETVYDINFGVLGLTKIQIAAACEGFSKLDEMNLQRAETADRLARGLIASEKYVIPGYDEHKRTNYLRLPVLARDENARERAIAGLRRIGVVATRMYPAAIPQIRQAQPILVDYPGDYPGAQTVVDRLFTLPTHSYVTDRDIERIVSCLT